MHSVRYFKTVLLLDSITKFNFSCYELVAGVAQRSCPWTQVFVLVLHKLFNKDKNYRAALFRGVRIAGSVLHHRLLVENQRLKTSELEGKVLLDSLGWCSPKFPTWQTWNRGERSWSLTQCLH